jgi:hypothetical protein
MRKKMKDAIFCRSRNVLQADVSDTVAPGITKNLSDLVLRTSGFSKTPNLYTVTNTVFGQFTSQFL